MKLFLFIISFLFVNVSLAQMSAQENGPIQPKNLDEAIEQCEKNSASVSESMGCVAAARERFKDNSTQDANCDQVGNGTGNTGCLQRPPQNAVAPKPDPRSQDPKPKKCIGVSNGTGGQGCVNESSSSSSDKKPKRKGAVAK